MPEVQEVFRMATQKVGPDPGALDRQIGQQRRRTIRRKMGVYGLVAALLGVIAVVAVRAGVGAGEGERVPASQPSSPATAPGSSATAGTVTFDGTTCSMEITADRIEPGIVTFDVVNTTDQRAMFDSWRLLDGYTVQEFEAVIERDRRIFESGKPGGVFPDQKTEVEYLSSKLVPANDSGILVSSMGSGPHAIVCLQPLGRPSPFGVVGPIAVG